jgi:hypothetical protein
MGQNNCRKMDNRVPGAATGKAYGSVRNGAVSNPMRRTIRGLACDPWIRTQRMEFDFYGLSQWI